MGKKNDLISILDLAKGLKMDRANLKKLSNFLKIEKKQIRGQRNQWTQAFSTIDVEIILQYRRGIEHNLVKTNGVYRLKMEKLE